MSSPLPLSRFWRLRGWVQLDEEVSDEAVLERLVLLLERQLVSVTRRDAAHIAFTSSIWRFRPTRFALATYDEGRFWIEHGPGGRTLRYDLRSLHVSVFLLALTLLSLMYGLTMAGWIEGLAFAAFTFGWLHGANRLFERHRIPKLVRAWVLSA